MNLIPVIIFSLSLTTCALLIHLVRKEDDIMAPLILVAAAALAIATVIVSLVYR